VPRGRAAITDRQRNGRRQSESDRLRVHCRLARRPLSLADARIRPLVPECVTVATAEY
jgi:hypothetical protein